MENVVVLTKCLRGIHLFMSSSAQGWIASLLEPLRQLTSSRMTASFSRSMGVGLQICQSRRTMHAEKGDML